MNVLLASTSECVLVYDSKTLTSIGKFILPKQDKKNASYPTKCVNCSDHLITFKGQFIFSYAYTKEAPLRKSILQDSFASFYNLPDFYIGGTTDGIIYVWDKSTGDCIRKHSAHFKSINFISEFSGCLVTASDDSQINFWDLSDLLDEDTEIVEPIRSIRDHSMPIRGLYFSAVGGRIFTCSEDKTLKIFDGEGKCILTVLLPCIPSCLAVNSCESMVYIGTVEGNIFKVNLYDIAMNAKVPQSGILSSDACSAPTKQKVHSSKLVSLVFSLTNEVMHSADESGKICVWDLMNGQMMKSIDIGVPCFDLSSMLKMDNLFNQLNHSKNPLCPLLARNVASKDSIPAPYEVELTGFDFVTRSNEVSQTQKVVSDAAEQQKENNLEKEYETLKTKYEKLAGLYSRLSKITGQALFEGLEQTPNR